MPREYSRSQRVAVQLQRELATLLRDHFDVPGGGLLTLTHVYLSPDLRHARVYFTLLGGAFDEKACARALNQKAGQLRHLLAGCFTMRGIPDLSFHHDENEARAARLDALIGEAAGTRGPQAKR